VSLQATGQDDSLKNALRRARSPLGSKYTTLAPCKNASLNSDPPTLSSLLVLRHFPFPQGRESKEILPCKIPLNSREYMCHEVILVPRRVLRPVLHVKNPRAHCCIPREKNIKKRRRCQYSLREILKDRGNPCDSPRRRIQQAPAFGCLQSY